MNKGVKLWLLLAFVSFLIPVFWNKIEAIRNGAHYLLDPSVGALLNWNVSWGFLLISGIIALITVILQRFLVDQETMRKLKSEQKLLQEEMKKYKDHPEKLMELQKRQLAFIPQTMDLTMKPLIYTMIPIILLYRWFFDYFLLNPAKIFGFMNWLVAYIVFSIIFSLILRKLFKMP